MPAWDGAPARLVEAIVGGRPADLDLRGARDLRPALRRGLSSAHALWSQGPSRSWPAGACHRRGPPTAAAVARAPRGMGRPYSATRRRDGLAAADHGGRGGGGVRALGADDEARAGPRHLQLRFALVPPAVRGGDGAESLRHRDASRRHRLYELVLPAELGAAARGRDAAGGAGHAVVVPQLRVAGGGVPGCLVHRQAVWEGGPQRGGCGDPARGACAGRAGARGGQERPHGRRPDPGRDRDPRQRLGPAPPRQHGRVDGPKVESGTTYRPIGWRSGGRWRSPGSRWGWRRGRR